MKKYMRIIESIFILFLSFTISSCKNDSGNLLGDAIKQPQKSIVIFKVDTPVQGDFGSTHQTDCESAKASLGIAGSNVKPFISIGLASEIKDIPGVPQTGVPVVSVTNVQLKSDWSSLWADDTIDASLFDAGVLPSSTDTWWTGTYNNGQTGGGGANNCTNWTNTGSIGQFGNANVTDQTWIWDAATDSCTLTKYRLCVAWE